MKEKFSKLSNFLTSPYTIFGSIFSGILIGLFAPTFAKMISPIGDFFLSLLQMCIIPIIFTAITYSLASLLKQKNVHLYLTQILIIFTTGLLVSGFVTIAFCWLIGVGNSLDETSVGVIGKLLSGNDMHKNFSETSAPSFFSFLRGMVPENIFTAFSEGKILAILTFSIFFGIAVGRTPKHEGSTIFEFFDDMNQAFLRLINAFMYALPVGLLCIFAGQLSTFGTAIFSSMVKLLICIYIVSFLALFVFSFILKQISKGKILDPFTKLKKPLIVAFATSSSFAAIPSSVKALEDNLKLDGKIAKLVVPLGVCLNPQGTTILVSSIAMFMCQFYGIPLTFQSVMILILGSILTGIAMSGVPGIGVLTMLAIVVHPLGLPLAPAAVIAMAILPFTEPIITMVNVFGNCFATIVLSKKVASLKV